MDRQRLTSLAWAALEQNLEVFEWLLLDYGHDDQELSRDIEHNTIFHLLASAPAPASISPLAHLYSPHFPPRPNTRTREESVEIALRMTDTYYTLFPFLLDWSNNSGKTPLHHAAQADNHEFIALLCDLGADVDLADMMGNTPLHYASAWGHVNCIRVLLERGAAVNTRNMDGFTPPDFAFTNSTKLAIESIAKEVVEERRRRREENKRREAEEAAEADAESSWQGHNGYDESLPPDIVAAAAAASQARSERRGSRSTFNGSVEGRPERERYDPSLQLETFDEVASVPTLSLVTPTPTAPNIVSGLGLGEPSPTPSPVTGSGQANGWPIRSSSMNQPASQPHAL